VIAFESTIGQLVILAAIMPVVAGLGGNAGTQALAVTVRRTALGLVPPGAGRVMVRKEMLVGLINGLAVGLVVGLVTTLLGQGWAFGVVVMIAMWGSLFVAATVGASIPLVLHRLGLDPAVGSSVFITAITDIVGFFILLWLASAVLLPAA
jgi:magnesium transporter